MTPPPVVAPIVHTTRTIEPGCRQPRGPRTPGGAIGEHQCRVGAVIAGDAGEAEAVSRHHAARVPEDALAAGPTGAS